ncbi:hypothetical protein Syun_006611 [Stephania yunnanensis]|uniref:Uncharacterized protein n=1 Tax=Stephania yunnanensis TaxID=152371 RepID=A0AAP0PYN9_9MAGN
MHGGEVVVKWCRGGSIRKMRYLCVLATSTSTSSTPSPSGKAFVPRAHVASTHK